MDIENTIPPIETQTAPEHETEPAQDTVLTPKEQALTELLQETKAVNADLVKQLNDLKVLNEKLLLKTAGDVIDDNTLFNAFDKYNKN